ncbi:MAG: molecular chaperone TorD family protein [Sulfurospirillaceae bacterium]|nr:molecular chaperone TorD family protein [Sulfurospirillaceae bacterium]MCK9546062.1 molecular chaperone TorD family protein [Sulfurospirillaceae bacterium]
MLFDRLKIVQGLRDLFLANDSKAFHLACEALEVNTKNIDEFEGEFNRFFVGPKAPLAAPYASLYLESRGTIMSKTTESVRELYSFMGFVNPKEGSIPEDFLGLELDAYYQLLHVELVKKIDYLKSLRIFFLKNHILTWIPDFIESVKGASKKPSNELLALMDLIDAFFNSELSIQGENDEK